MAIEESGKQERSPAPTHYAHTLPPPRTREEWERLDHIWLFVAHRRKLDGTPQSVSAHLQGVATAAAQFADKLGLSMHGKLLGLLHDLGKYSKDFQDYISGEDAATAKGRVDHSTAGAQLLWNELSKGNPFSPVLAQFMALCAASHHGGLIDCLKPDGGDAFSARMNKDDSSVHLMESLRKADCDVREHVQQLLSDPALVRNLRDVLKAIYDKQQSVGEVGKEVRIGFCGGLLLRMLFSCLIDADHTDSADFEKPEGVKLRPRGKYPSWDVLLHRLENHLRTLEARCPIDRLRSRISEECLTAAQKRTGIFTLTVPTGGGKTLASLRFAIHHARRWDHERIIYVLPYTTIIDQNAAATRSILEPEGTPGSFASVVLEHHSNLVPEKETAKSKLLAENWDAPVIYTTMVQMLESLFGAGTRNAKRMHRLANAVIIFDEIQTLPVNTVHLFCNAINLLVDHCGSSVVLCTATQPLLDKVDRTKGALILGDDAEIITDVASLFDDLKRVDVVDATKPGGWDDTELAALAFRSVKEAGSCLVVVNTKRAALSLYARCKASEQPFPVCHLSTSMCPAHRLHILERIYTRLGKAGKPPEEPGPLLCISTQLIEAGVDVDFGAVIRFAAGLDSIAQAAGRCNRNKRRDKGVVTVVNPANEDLRHLDGIRVGREAAVRVLAEFADAPETLGGDLLSPAAIARYFRYYFFERKHLMDYPISGERDDTLLNMLSINCNAVAEYARCNAKAPGIYWRQSFMTAAEAFKAIDAPTQGLVVPYGDKGMKLIGDMCAASTPAELGALLRQAQRYSVNVFPWVLDRLQMDGAVHEVQPGTGILHLDPQYYSEEFGLSPGGGAEMPFLNG